MSHAVIYLQTRSTFHQPIRGVCLLMR